MKPLSAIEAFTPALERTKAMLRPFSLQLWLKLGLVAIIAELGMQFLFPPVGNFNTPAHPQSSGIGAVAGRVTPLLITLFVIMGVVAFLIGLALLYFGSRMQLVLMDLVATRSTLVSPSWRLQGPKTWRWLGLKLVCFIAIFAVVGAMIALPIIYVFRSLPANGNPQPNAAFFGSFFLIFVMIFLTVFVMMLMIWTLRDFVLPFILFENASLGTAVRRASALIRGEVVNVLFYFLMKFALWMAAGLAAELCIAAAMLILAIPIGLVVSIFWLALHHAGAFGTLFMYISFGLLGAIGLAALLIVIICVAGAILIFLQAYALYFLGGRIPTLGNLLEPPPPPLVEALPAVSPA